MSRRLLGVCSWSLQVGSLPELVKLVREVGAEVVQIGLGDPNHGSWQEGDRFIPLLKESGLALSAAMIGFPQEDYTSPATIRQTGGFGDPATRTECLTLFRDAVDRTAALGLEMLLAHAGFIPAADGPERSGFLDCIGEAAAYAASKDVVFTMETGQETAELLRRTLDELQAPSLKVNFDPANMLLYDMGDPIRAIDLLGSDIRHVHVKDARPPKVAGEWGEEVPLGEGDVGMESFLEALDRIGYTGPLVVEREVGSQEERVRDVRGGLDLLRRLAEA